MYRNSERQPLLDLFPPHSNNALDRRRDSGPSHKLPQPSPAYLEAPVRYGLQTPPEDNMGTAYQNPHYGNYAPRPDVSFPNGSRASSHGTSYSLAHQHSRSSSSLSQPPMNSQSIANVRSQAPVTQTSYSRPASPQRNNVQEPQAQSGTGSSNDQIIANLQIPKSINNSGGSLAEFAAQITCLFWFETTEILKDAENVTPTTIVPRLKTEALPTTGFRKWVVTTLTTTQVSRNVILLALLFIYRLKNINPGVKGRCGSEYRLLTVALMLGNKFLDDNTYTNKTWAEVSGISVTEIHVMEVEFLSNMRYTLLASKEQWAEWQQKLAKFWIYCDNAGKTPSMNYSSQGIPVLQPLLPSPPTSLQSSPPSAMTSHLTVNSTLNANYPQSAQLHSISKKRGSDEAIDEPAAKRVSRPHSTIPTPYPSLMQDTQSMQNETVRLPVPNLTISTTLPMSNGPIGNVYHTPSNLMQGGVPVLPPLSGRAMSSVYPPSSQSWTPNPPLLTPTGPLPAPQISGYSTPTRRHSPHSVQELLSLGSSPISGHFPHTQGHISPSFFLQQRSSPYRPVRHVDTLLYPPPSALMHDYSANVEQIQYQPLGRRNDYRQGVVPHYPQSSFYEGTAIRQPNFNPKPTPGYAPQA